LRNAVSLGARFGADPVTKRNRWTGLVAAAWQGEARAMCIAGSVLVACLASGMTLAQAVQTPPGPASKEVAPVTVMPRTDPPRVISTFPSAGEAIAPGLFVLKVTFDQKMQEKGFDFAAVPGGEAPDCLKTPRLLDDEKTFVLLCRATAGKTYELALNAGAAGGFANLAGQRALPATVSIKTTSGEPVRTLKDAMKVANLRDTEAPIMDTPGVSEDRGLARAITPAN
jgi:hypothetical protein